MQVAWTINYLWDRVDNDEKTVHISTKQMWILLYFTFVQHYLFIDAGLLENLM